MNVLKPLIISSSILAGFVLAGCGNDVAIVTSDVPEVDMAACGVNEAEHERLMSLSQNEFDQDMTGGWRAVAHKDGCTEVGIALLESYIERHNVVSNDETKILFWHAGQLKAYTGDYPGARKYFKQSYDHDTDVGSHENDWALYARGTIAFVDRDLVELKNVRKTLSEVEVSENQKESRRKFLRDNPNINMPANFIDEPANLSVLDKLIRCFDKPYREAYGRCKA